MVPRQPLSKRLTRREVLAFVAVAGAAAVVACGDDKKTPAQATATSAPASSSPTAASGATSTPAPSSLSCIVSPEMTEGPYFVDEMLDRSDIRTDPSDGSSVEGVPLTLTLNVYEVNGDACTPISGAHVDIWHCDAAGLYSDVSANNTVGQQFLRGYQLTDGNGAVKFVTIYPGWYMGRAVHIHMKVRTDPEAQSGLEFTSQLFFDETTMAEVYAQAPYSSRGTPDTPNSADQIYQGGGDQMLLALTADGQGYAGTMSIGIATT